MTMKSTCSTGTSRARQAGVTIIELLVVVAIIAVISGGAIVGLNIRNDRVGANEGGVISYALQCAQSKNSAPTFAAMTLAVMANYGCFPNDNVTGAGSAAASALSSLTGQVYTVTPVNISGTNDGLQISLTRIPAKNCPGLVKAAAALATRVLVTPLGGAATTVKAVGGQLVDATVGTACGAAASASIRVIIGKS